MPNYPTSASTNDSLYVAVNGLKNSLSAPITASDTTIGLVSTIGFPSSGSVLIDSEIIRYNGISVNNLISCTRGFDGTTATLHSSAATVSFSIIADHHNVLKDEVVAMEADLVGTLAALTPVTAGSTATSLLNRLSQIVQRFKDITGLANWYDTFTFLPVAKGGTNSGTALNNNRVMKSASGAIVEAAAITPSKALQSDSNGIPTHSSVTSTELGYVAGVTSSIQTQLNSIASTTVPVGAMLDFGGISAPSGWLLCDGSEVSQTTYASLFAVVSTNFNTGGEGAGNFRLPDFRRRVSVGSGGTGTGTLGNAVGNSGGEEDHTLTTTEMPTHSHSVTDPGHLHNGNFQALYTAGAGLAPSTNHSGGTIQQITESATTGISLGDAGSGGVHNNIQPSLVVTKIIKT